MYMIFNVTPTLIKYVQKEAKYRIEMSYSICHVYIMDKSQNLVNYRVRFNILALIKILIFKQNTFVITIA